MTNDKEKLLIKVIHFLAERFKENIVLEGGMLLRMFNSPRSTQDVDYYLISDLSKKKLAAEIKKEFDLFADAKIIDMKLNSRGIFIDMEDSRGDAGKIIVEINVVPSLNMPSEPISTVSLSNQYSLSGRVVASIALPEAFSHKISACIERRSMRDLYDISILETLCEFDIATLQKRFESLSINREKPKKMPFATAANILEKRAKEVNERSLRDELYPLIPTEQQPGLQYVIKAAVMRVVQRLRVSI
jgi:predicted nucleotidyltransferase component of viral defense system